MGQIQKIDRVRAPWATRFASWLQRSSAMLLQSTIGKTALLIENEMFRDGRTQSRQVRFQGSRIDPISCHHGQGHRIGQKIGKGSAPSHPSRWPSGQGWKSG
jgi:hypothetical protein